MTSMDGHTLARTILVAALAGFLVVAIGLLHHGADEVTSGYLWKYAQQVGPARKGAVTHPGGSVEKECYADI